MDVVDVVDVTDLMRIFQLIRHHQMRNMTDQSTQTDPEIEPQEQANEEDHMTDQSTQTDAEIEPKKQAKRVGVVRGVVRPVVISMPRTPVMQPQPIVEDDGWDVPVRGLGRGRGRVQPQPIVPDVPVRLGRGRALIERFQNNF